MPILDAYKITILSTKAEKYTHNYSVHVHHVLLLLQTTIFPACTGVASQGLVSYEIIGTVGVPQLFVS